jgi:hypothetical protein
MPEYQIDFTIRRDGVEVGFGGANGGTVDFAAETVATLLQRREWETTPGMPDPTEVDADRES